MTVATMRDEIRLEWEERRKELRFPNIPQKSVHAAKSVRSHRTIHVAGHTLGPGRPSPAGGEQCQSRRTGPLLSLAGGLFLILPLFREFTGIEFAVAVDVVLIQPQPGTYPDQFDLPGKPFGA